MAPLHQEYGLITFQEEMWGMQLFKSALFALGICAAVVLPASAGWDNVFQPTLFNRWCNSCSPQPQVARYYVAPTVVQSSPVVVAQSSPCDPCQKCTTNYVQRSYYQPVTTYQTQTVMQQVTTMRTS